MTGPYADPTGNAVAREKRAPRLGVVDGYGLYAEGITFPLSKSDLKYVLGLLDVELVKAPGARPRIRAKKKTAGVGAPTVQ